MENQDIGNQQAQDNDIVNFHPEVDVGDRNEDPSVSEQSEKMMSKARYKENETNENFLSNEGLDIDH